MSCQAKSTTILLLTAICVIACYSQPTLAQIMVAQDDFHGLKLNEPLVVDAPGLLDNDLLGGEAATDFGAVAELVVDAAYGTLVLTPDGAFTYSPGPLFTGQDSFVYAAVAGAASDQATVFLTACTGGPDVFVCWEEAAFMALAGDLGYYKGYERFDGPVWSTVRAPNSAPSVVSQGVRWTSNYTGTPVANPISTNDSGGAGSPWIIYDPNHGYAEGTPAVCDVDFPDSTCLYHDGFTGEVVTSGQSIVGVSAVIDGDWSSNVAIILDDLNPYPSVPVYYQQFMGIIDARPAGFTKFSFQEQSGKVGQQSLIWGHDFTYLTTAPAVSAVPEPATRIAFAGASPNPASAGTIWRFRISGATVVQLRVFDVRGRLVRQLADRRFEAGEQAIAWDGRDSSGRRLAAGTYFGMLKTSGAAANTDLIRKIIILH